MQKVIYMKKLILLAMATLSPFFASAATLNNNFSTGSLFPTAGSSMSVSSTCGISAGNNTVSFALMQNGVNTPLAGNLSTDANGAFTGNVSFPSTTNPGTATIIATCNRTGDTVSSPVLTFSAPASTSFGLPQNQPNISGIYNLSGSCGNSNGAGSVILSLTTSNGGSYTLDTANLSSTGTFSDNVVIPNNISTGTATFTAACSNALRFSSTVNINPAAVNLFALGSNPFPGSNTNISGTCNNISGNLNGTMSFNVLRNGFVTNLPATSAQTNGSGSFNSSVFFPNNVGSDPATLVITCPNGSTFSNVIMLGAASVTLNPVATTPVGAVAAGSGPQTGFNYFAVAVVLLIAGSLGLFAVTGKNFHAQK